MYFNKSMFYFFCRYVHYEVDTEKVVIPTSPTSKGLPGAILETAESLGKPTPKSVLHPPQWIQ